MTKLKNSIKRKEKKQEKVNRPRGGAKEILRVAQVIVSPEVKGRLTTLKEVTRQRLPVSHPDWTTSQEFSRLAGPVPK